MVKLKLDMKKSEMKKTAATLGFGILLAAGFFTLFHPADTAAILTWAIFFVLVPSYAFYYVIDKLFDKFLPDKEKVEVIE
ncbi:MAG: hypothetical protein HYU56_01350 [Candidatus Aenigmarchaeota archaeon]|nr:hypothetical protein [Candidatus Aenigmarchaeota archaeon]